MKNKVTAIFDIGKTNKKFFLFDANYQEVYREYIRLEEIVDEDGHPTENLKALEDWLRKVFDKILKSEKYEVVALNFSTYGASLVHLDEDGGVLTPLYNYTKPLDPKLVDSFFEKYGPEAYFAATTGSTNDGMLNSGMQLYWLKHKKPAIFEKVKYSLHLPQYISYIFTGVPVSEYSSIGCHTALWNYTKKEYHSWVNEEGITKILPPIVSADTTYIRDFHDTSIKIGVGVHDSSAALLTYTSSIKKKFLLVSTGTWSIALNPFSKELLREEDVANNCINYMNVNSGEPVKSARLFLGNEYTFQVKSLSKHFEVAKEYHKSIRFNQDTYLEIIKDLKPMFSWHSFETIEMPSETKITYDTFEYSYHHLMIELVQLQVETIRRAQGESVIEELYVDGGFSDNEVYVKLLAHYLYDIEMYTTDSSLGSALGAAIVISDADLNSGFLKKNYSLKRQIRLITA